MQTKPNHVLGLPALGARANNRWETDWLQKYRPESVKDCILPSRLKRSLEKMASKPFVHNLIFHGSYGVGKTAGANALCRDAGCEPCLINGSVENGIDDLRRLEPFVCTRSFDGSRRVVLIDEADRLSREYQDGLRGLIEELSSNCSFIFTTNDLSKISGALQSRCLAMDFGCSPEEIPFLKEEFAARLNQILAEEQASYQPKVLAEIIAAGFPDFRQILKQVQLECGC